MKMKNNLQKLILSALFLGLAYLLPFLTGQIPRLGAMLCPMHIPVLLCGFLCGWQWGLCVGLIAPFLRSVTLGAPVLFPMAVCMCFELAAYGAFAGLFYKIFPRKKVFLYPALILSMAAGRVIWGVAMFFCQRSLGTAFGLKAFLSGAVLSSLPGIALQIVLIPVLVMAVQAAGKQD